MVAAVLLLQALPAEPRPPYHDRAGEEHSAVVTECGALFTFGRGSWGALGQSGQEDCLLPVQVTQRKAELTEPRQQLPL